MKKSVLVGIATLVLVLIGFAGFQYLKDPGGHSRRHPQSMHAHQSGWPAGCQHREASLQSPISISSATFTGKALEMTQLKLNEASAELIDVGHTFQVRFRAAPAAEVTFEGTVYELRQFHFHKPSEHLIDGKQFEMEVHFVFLPVRPGPSKALVLGYPVLVGDDHTELAKIWKFLPPYREGYGEVPHEALDWHEPVLTHELEVKELSHNEKLLKDSLSIDLAKFFPAKANYFVYEGSLTTPSCDEGIIHAVSLTPIQFGHEQIEHFEGYYEGTNRDLQPVNNPSTRKFRRAEIVLSKGGLTSQ